MVVIGRAGTGGAGRSGARCAQENARKDAQNFRGRSQEDGHRRTDCAPSAAAAVCWAHIGITGVEYGELGWRTVLCDVIERLGILSENEGKSNISLFCLV